MSHNGHDDLNQQAKRIQELVETISQVADPAMRAMMEECLQGVLQLHGVGLERILKIVTETRPASDPLYNQLIHDGVVSGLLLIHGLHPVELADRLQEALGKVLPYIHSHGGDVELISLENGVAQLRLKGTCHGCPSSAVTLELAIKQAIDEACPDLLGLDVEGVAPAPEPKLALNPAAPRWTILDDFAPPTADEFKAVEVSGVSLLVCNVHGNLYAYGNRCPECDLPLASGTLENGLLRCRDGHAYDVRRAGISATHAERHLNPFPLLVEGQRVKVSSR